MSIDLPEFIQIPSTPFLMGTPEAELSSLAKAYGGTRESYREEAPQHQLVLPAFAIARTPVTNTLYAAFVRATAARAPLYWRGSQPSAALLNHPVVDTSWEEATAFCTWLRSGDIELPGIASPELPGFRLPSEAEWEHAARGIAGWRFPWGEEWQTTAANTREAQIGSTRPVGSYPAGASPYGCLDMAGGIWEWTCSLDLPYPYNPNDGREELATPGRRILRGGCYANPHGYARCACRFRLLPTVRNEFLGFRVAFSLPDPPTDSATISGIQG
jgi:toxoflavin biosynthesis protein ToxD